MKIQDSQSVKHSTNGKHHQPVTPLYADLHYENEGEKLDARQVFGILQRRAWVVVTVAIAVSTTIGYRSLNRPPLYEGQFRLLVEPITAETKVAQTFGAIVYSTLDYDTQIEVLRSPTVSNPLVEQIKQTYADIDYNSLMQKLTISRLGETKIIEVRYRDSDPNKVKDILAQIAQGYLDYSRVERQSNIKEGIDFVKDRLPELQGRVNTLQAKLQKFRQQYNFIDPEVQAQQLSNQIASISQQKLEVQTKLNETRLLYATLQNQLGLQPNQALVAAALSESGRYQKLLDKLQDLEAKLASESVRFTPENPTIQSLKEEREKLLPILRQEAQQIIGNNLANAKVDPQKLTYQNSVRLGLTQQFVDAANQIRIIETRNIALNNAEAKLIQDFKQMPLRAREYTDLQRELKVSTESLTRFLETQESLQIEAAQKAAPWQLIAPPKEAFAIAPDTYRNIALGVVAGLLLGFGAAWIVEMLDSVFHSSEDLKEKTGLPLLAVIPFNKAIKKIKTTPAPANTIQQPSFNLSSSYIDKLHRYSSSPFLEAFRSFYTNIRLLGSDMPVRSLVISSATPAEGKTVVALNLALAAAAMGQRVLLVDADLRRPQIHERMSLPNMRGLTNLLASEDLDFNNFIQQSHLEENLFVMTAGQIPPDPTRLLSSEKMQNLMGQLRISFNLVIYDTPPLVGFADANLLATPTDGLVLVVGLGKTDRYVLIQALDGLRIAGTNVLGMAANGIKEYTVRANDTYDRYYKQAGRKPRLDNETTNRMGNG